MKSLIATLILMMLMACSNDNTTGGDSTTDTLYIANGNGVEYENTVTLIYQSAGEYSIYDQETGTLVNRKYWTDNGSTRIIGDDTISEGYDTVTTTLPQVVETVFLG